MGKFGYFNFHVDGYGGCLVMCSHDGPAIVVKVGIVCFPKLKEGSIRFNDAFGSSCSIVEEVY